MTKPNFFIVGAPKCGTTGLYHYLAQHPQVFVPAKKEIHYFGTDIYSPSYLRDTAKYLSLFAGADHQKRIGEASVWYLYSKRSAREIKEFSDSAKILIMLRNPIDMIYSLHSQRLFIGSEDIESFEQALLAEDDRKKGLRLPKNPYPIEGLFYREVGLYSDQVQRYLDVFGWKDVKVIIFDDLKHQPNQVYRETCEFLEIDPEFTPSIRIVNPNKRVRSKAFRSLLDDPPQLFRMIGRPLTTTSFRHQILRELRRLNTKYVSRPPMAQSLRQKLQTHFAPDVQRLSKLINRDLSFWP